MHRGDVLALLNKYASSDASWYAHCLHVSATAHRLAELISQRGHPVDIERAAALGLLHDLGRSRGHTLRHGIEGYLLARAEGHEEEGRICLIHILKGRTLEEGVQLGMLTQQELQQLRRQNRRYDRPSFEEKIVCVADALLSDTGLGSIEEKYANARRRYGALPHHYEDEAWIQGIATELAELLGRTPYEALAEESNDLL